MRFLSLIAVALSGALHAAPVSVQVTGVDGRPLAGAVVTLIEPGAPAPAVRGPYQMAQHNIAFEPHLLIVPVGATVQFPNQDKVRHHVYSFSKAKKFDLKLYGHDEARSVLFDRPGVVALGCNIHDRMSGVIYVTPTPYAAETDAAGRVRFADAGQGRATLVVWHPSIRDADNQLSEPVMIAPAGLSTAISLKR